ncbi:MAG: uncharacterized protein JWN70_836 [Planctomycetaceae bacterium]|nr:uncharacterized protein [Planctomycetaceae bacterium]
MPPEITDLSLTSLHLLGVDELKKRSGWFIGLGIALVVLGMMALGSAMIFTLASMVFIGSLLAAAGILQTIHALLAKRWGGFFVDLLMGVMNIVVGLLIAGHPAAVAAALTLLIAVFLIVGGIFRIVLAMAIRFQHVFWLVLHGVINVMLGVMILQEWPISGLWVIGLFIGIDMVFNGWALIMLGMAAKKLPAA